MPPAGVVRPMAQPGMLAAGGCSSAVACSRHRQTTACHVFSAWQAVRTALKCSVWAEVQLLLLLLLEPMAIAALGGEEHLY